ncbi:OmpA family protein [uncultured Croceitalea sp.]|uniref:OmpA family protein n=1 Tax=uncultured Croceitalea sp. TaxID=1798908 RepID=UPI003305A959
MKKLVLFSALVLSMSLSSQTITSIDFDDKITPEENSGPQTISKEAEVEKFKKLSKKRLSGDDKHSLSERLIRKADSYFDKMWYAEAAELYDLALKKSGKNFDRALLQKAGDSHFFNSDMEKAHFWYSKLYELYNDDLSESDYFRYSHSLKGIGRYKKAKRIIEAFTKKNLTGNAQSAIEKSAKERAELMAKSIELKNLNSNSEYSDFSPMYRDKGELVFASAKDSAFLNTRRYKWNDQPFLDLYVGQVGEKKEQLKNVKKFSKKVNSKYHEAAVSFSPDKKVMYFTRNNYGKKLKRGKNGVSHLKLFRSELVGEEWTEPVELSFNSDEYSTGHPATSPDGKKLYFVSDMPGGFGGTDIYVVDILENGKFSEPKNLGRRVNSTRREMFPFVTENTVFFSSDRAMGLGGLDIYKSGYFDEKFEIAVNVGGPINSNRDDFSYITNTDGQTGYFASNRKGGKGDDDIYAFEALEIAEEIAEKTSSIVGNVTELITGDVLSSAIVQLLDENGEVIEETQTSDDGSFVFNELKTNSTYSVATKNDDFFEDTQAITIANEESVDVTVSLKRLDDMIVLEDGLKKLETDIIYFDFDRDEIRGDAKKELDKLLEVWEKYPDMVIKIESHTDAIGPKAYNEQLSDRRAKATRDYLLSQGIDKSRIYSAIGYGEQYLKNDCGNGGKCTRQKHQENRRSEFIVVSM